MPADGSGCVCRREWVCLQKGVAVSAEGSECACRWEWLCLQKGVAVPAEGNGCVCRGNVCVEQDCHFSAETFATITGSNHWFTSLPYCDMPCSTLSHTLSSPWPVLQGHLMLKEGGFSEAERHFKQGLEYQPKNHLLWGLLGNVFLGQGDHSKAAECFSTALSLEQAAPSLPLDHLHCDLS